jgi:hypothetical protein
MKIHAELRGRLQAQSPAERSGGVPLRNYSLDVTLAPSSPARMCRWKDEDLVEECLRGNAQAWAVIVDKYKAWVYCELIEYKMGLLDAADLFQEVWVELYSDLGRLRAPGDLRAWLMAAVWHKGTRRVREPSERMSFSEWKEQAEKRQALRDMTARLQERRTDIYGSRKR